VGVNGRGSEKSSFSKALKENGGTRGGRADGIETFRCVEAEKSNLGGVGVFDAVIETDVEAASGDVEAPNLKTGGEALDDSVLILGGSCDELFGDGVSADDEDEGDGDFEPPNTKGGVTGAVGDDAALWPNVNVEVLLGEDEVPKTNGVDLEGRREFAPNMNGEGCKDGMIGRGFDAETKVAKVEAVPAPSLDDAEETTVGEKVGSSLHAKG
jgi:hypothetical protein